MEKWYKERCPQVSGDLTVQIHHSLAVLPGASDLTSLGLMFFLGGMEYKSPGHLLGPFAWLLQARQASQKACSPAFSQSCTGLCSPSLCFSLTALPVTRSPPPSTLATSTKSSSSPWWPHFSWALGSSSCCSGLASTYELPRVRAVTGWGTTAWLMETDSAEWIGTPDTCASFPVPDGALSQL